MQKSLVRKGVVLGIIVLFVGASIIPSISGNIGINNIISGESDAATSKYIINEGSLSGYVNDTLMNPMEGARVRVYFHGTYEEDYSDSSGYYHVTNIPICYCMKNATASKEGYITEWVLLSISENTTYDFVLTPSDGNTLYVGGSGPNNYSRIQDAVDNTSNGDTVFVYNGIYFENVIITEKAINLIGEDKDNTIVDGGGSGDALFIFMPVGEINIGGFTFQNSGTSCAGIFIDYGLDHVCRQPVSVNQKTNIYDEILINIYNNILTNNGVGIWFCWWTYNVHIFMNNLIGNVDGIIFDPFSNFNIVSQNNILDSNYGIFLLNSESNNISGNVITNNEVGVGLDGSSNNNIIANSISYNENGIKVEEFSIFNFFYHNNLINNTMNAYDQCYNNTWDNGYPSGGNYWDDYGGDDEDGDGIGDTPYDLPCEYATDWYPLMYPWGENPPVAEFTYWGNNLSVLFDAVPSYDRDGYITTWLWDFGDGVEGAGIQVEHVYNEPGTYEVTLTVIDDDGYEGRITKQIEVEDGGYEFETILIIGRITNLNAEGDFITFEAVNIQCITFFPFTFNPYTSGEKITILQDYIGVVGTRFIFALCGASI